MTLKVHNTLTHRLEEFTPLEPGVVRMYNCGPTVYNHQHLGNYRTYAFADVLRRYLEYSGHRVMQVINITDVGHLTQDDVEAGEDKMDVMARKLGWDPYKVAEFYMNAYFADRRTLGYLEPLKWTRATEYVPEMIAMIGQLLEKGFAYRVGGNVYFEVAKFAEYGRLSGNTLEQIKAGASERIDFSHEKRHPADFALWKTDAKHLMQFDSPWGRGFPGWHIECSAMSRKWLGDTLDIHTGGEDNIFPHHECEIAQSEAVTGKKFVRYWMHARHVQWDGKKMSKSLGNVFLLKDALDRGYKPVEIRFGLVTAHYRHPVNFSWKLFDDAKSSVARLNALRHRLAEKPQKGLAADLVAQARARFRAAMDDDLNVSGAIAAVHDLATEVNRRLDRGEPCGGALEELHGFDRVFGFFDDEENRVPAETMALVAQREEARKKRDWKESDLLRDEIRKLGWIVEDGKDGQKVKKAR